jgi:hypothetical protein
MSEQRPTADWLSAPETLALLGVADRTLRKWVARGRLHREFGSDGRPRYRREEVERLAAEGANASPPDSHVKSPSELFSPNDTCAVPAPAAAAREPDRERQLLAEIAWLRERLAQAQEAEREFRLLLLQSTRTIEALGGKAALTASAPSVRSRSARLRARAPTP